MSGTKKEKVGNDGQYIFDPNETFQEIICSEDWKSHRPPEYADYRRDWDLVPRNKTEVDFPIHLDIETTNVCNLRCPMCPRTVMVEDGTFGETGMMSREEYASIIDQGAMHGLKSVKLNYLGEPLAHKDVVWQVAYAKEKGIVDVMMNTNASLLTPDRSKALLEAGIDSLFVSFDAISPDLFEDRRTGTTLGKVVDNLYGFVRLRDKGYPHVQIRVSMVMYEDPKWREQFEGLAIMWRHLVDGIGYGYYTERDTNVLGDHPEVPGFWCAQPYQRMFLKYNGNVTICCFDDKDAVVVGNWREQKLHDIWHGQAYQDIRRLHSEGNYYQMEICRKCHFPVSE